MILSDHLYNFPENGVNSFLFIYFFLFLAEIVGVFQSNASRKFTNRGKTELQIFAIGYAIFFAYVLLQLKINIITLYKLYNFFRKSIKIIYYISLHFFRI